MTNNYVYRKPQEELFEYSKDITTPAVIYDINQLEETVKAIKGDIHFFKQAKLNFALKACYNKDVLQVLVDNGLGCDVASVNEYKIAHKAGFKHITTTAPAYEIADMDFFYNQDVIMDLDSIEQIEQFGKKHPNSSIGLRVYVKFPEIYENNASFGANSRFGIDVLDDRIKSLAEKYKLNIVRLHVHTGQMSPDALKYKIKYLLTIAEYYKDVDTIDLGGGFFYLYNDRLVLRNTLHEISDEVSIWEKVNDRKMTFVFEPGGAIVTPCGYLVTSVMAVKYNSIFKYRMINVNASAWNMAPWHNASVYNVTRNDANANIPTIIAGNTLYELDYFGGRGDRAYSLFEMGEVSAGDKIILSMFGGYTYTNARRFNCISEPKEYVLYEGALKECC